MHWFLSCLAGWLLTGWWRPVCSISWDLPDCTARTRFHDTMSRAFGEDGHCARVHVEWLERRNAN